MGDLASKLAYTKRAREEIRAAIVSKGIECPGNAPFCEFDTYIHLISSGSGGGSDCPKLHVPEVSIYRSKEIRIIDKPLNGIFSEKVDIVINSEKRLSADMIDGYAAIPFEPGELNVSDELTVIVTAQKFQASQPFSKVLGIYDFISYGDGSLTQVTNGYNNHLIINNVDIETNITYTNYFAGNINNENGWVEAFKLGGHSYNSYRTPLFDRSTDNYNTTQTSDDGKVYQAWQRVLSGTKTYTNIVCDATLCEKTCCLGIYGGYYTSSIRIGVIKFNVEGIGYLTLQEMVDNGIITPLVLMWSGTTEGSYYFSNINNLYTGGYTEYGSWPTGYIYFIVNTGYIIKDMTMYASGATSTNYPDGMCFSTFDHDLFMLSYRDN